MGVIVPEDMWYGHFFGIISLESSFISGGSSSDDNMYYQWSSLMGSPPPTIDQCLNYLSSPRILCSYCIGFYYGDENVDNCLEKFHSYSCSEYDTIREYCDYPQSPISTITEPDEVNHLDGNPPGKRVRTDRTSVSPESDDHGISDDCCHRYDVIVS